MSKVETLAQAMARFDDVLDNVESVATFSAIINTTSNFDFISETINKAANERGMYIGDISWSMLDGATAKLIVGVGASEKDYSDRYRGTKDDASRFRWA